MNTLNPHITLWPPQIAATQAVQVALRARVPGGLLVIPTGGGKTITTLTIARLMDSRTLFLCHRDRLIQQTVAAASRAWPEASVGVIKAERDEWGGDLFDGPPKLVIASVQSLHQERLEDIPRDWFNLLIIDEAHHAASPSWKRVIDHFDARFKLGVTATPQRLDKKGLDELFGRDPLYSYSLFQAIADGHLAVPLPQQVKTQLDLSQIKTRLGDFNLQKLANACNTPSRNKQIVETWRASGEGRRTIAFCVDIDHCESLVQEFANAGVRAAAVHSKMLDDQDAILDAFAAGKLDVLVSCEVLTEGFDDPGVSCILMCRPTMSRALYIQMVGRGLRKHPDKQNCIVIDFTDNCDRHKLVCSLDLFGKKKRAKSDDVEFVPVGGGGPPKPVQDVPVLSWRLEESTPWPTIPTLDNYISLFPWDDKPATDAQIKYLRSFPISIKHGPLTKGEVSYLIDRCKECEATWPVPATKAQRRLLEMEGMWSDGMSKRQATVMIGNLKRAERREEVA